MASIDNIFAMVSFFALVIFMLALLLFWNAVTPLDDDLWSQSSVGPKIKNNGQNLINTIDYIMIFVWFGLHLGIIVLAYLLRTHPVVYVASIIIMAVLVMVAVPLSNAYEDIILDSEISVAAGDIPRTNFIINQLPRFELIWCFVTALALFAFARTEGLV